VPKIVGREIVLEAFRRMFMCCEYLVQSRGGRWWVHLGKAGMCGGIILCMCNLFYIGLRSQKVRGYLSVGVSEVLVGVMMGTGWHWRFLGKPVCPLVSFDVAVARAPRDIYRKVIVSFE
jgi:hypothetical protein